MGKLTNSSGQYDYIFKDDMLTVKVKEKTASRSFKIRISDLHPPQLVNVEISERLESKIRALKFLWDFTYRKNEYLYPNSIVHQVYIGGNKTKHVSMTNIESNIFKGEYPFVPPVKKGTQVYNAATGVQMIIGDDIDVSLFD